MRREADEEREWRGGHQQQIGVVLQHRCGNPKLSCCNPPSGQMVVDPKRGRCNPSRQAVVDPKKSRGNPSGQTVVDQRKATVSLSQAQNKRICCALEETERVIQGEEKQWSAGQGRAKARGFSGGRNPTTGPKTLAVCPLNMSDTS